MYILYEENRIAYYMGCELLKMMSENGIKIDDYKHIELFKEYLKRMQQPLLCMAIRLSLTLIHESE